VGAPLAEEPGVVEPGTPLCRAGLLRFPKTDRILPRTEGSPWGKDAAGTGDCWRLAMAQMASLDKLSHTVVIAKLR
jgi:hypothetical protein